MSENRFNIRVYGLLINDRSEVLLSHEKRDQWEFTKFPGGGLEWGEGTVDCLKREFLEEMGLEIEVGELFYLTDYFQQSVFNKKDQLISVYYRVHADDIPDDICSIEQRAPGSPDCENFHWVSIAGLTEERVTFPIDKIVVKKLIANNPL
jgi:8-oxo-dGTP diphosphatase